MLENLLPIKHHMIFETDAKILYPSGTVSCLTISYNDTIYNL